MGDVTAAVIVDKAPDPLEYAVHVALAVAEESHRDLAALMQLLQVALENRHAEADGDPLDQALDHLSLLLETPRVRDVQLEDGNTHDHKTVPNGESGSRLAALPIRNQRVAATSSRS